MNGPLVAAVCATAAEIEAARQRLGGRARIVHAEGQETAMAALERRVAAWAVRGAVVGGLVLGVVSAVVAGLLGASPAAAGGIALAVAVTGGPFLGSLTGFSTALHINERIAAALGPDAHQPGASVVYAWGGADAG